MNEFVYVCVCVKEAVVVEMRLIGGWLLEFGAWIWIWVRKFIQ